MGEEQSQEVPEKEKMSDAMAAGEETNKKDNNDDGIIVLKVFMHCEACARRVVRSLKGFPGVEDVMADSIEGIVRVKGKNANPSEVQGRVQERSRRKVELIAPLIPNPTLLVDDDEKKGENKEPPAPATIILKIQMHCEACARVIRKKLLKIKGVESTKTDLSMNQVAVTGTVDPTELVKQVYNKTKKKATVVIPPPTPTPPPLEESENKIISGSGDEEKKDEENADILNNKEEDRKQEDVRRNQILPTRHYTDHYQYPQYASNAYPPPPQIFSDENPNACFIM